MIKIITAGECRAIARGSGYTISSYLNEIYRMCERSAGDGKEMVTFDVRGLQKYQIEILIEHLIGNQFVVTEFGKETEAMHDLIIKWA